MLNRQLSSPGFTYSHDAVGNRAFRKVGSVNKIQYDWDAFNRMETYAVINQGPGITPGTGAAPYDYLPIRLRCTKLIDANLTTLEIDPEGDPVLSGLYDDESFDNDTTRRYRHDEQMTMEEEVTYASGGGTVIDETRYLLGARGIERLQAQRMASPSQNDPLKTAKRSCPLYDGHGNPDSPRRGGAHFPSAGRKRMIATLGRTATGYTIANVMKYDVWGAVSQSHQTILRQPWPHVRRRIPLDHHASSLLRPLRTRGVVRGADA